jgi:hypothetical protein
MAVLFPARAVPTTAGALAAAEARVRAEQGDTVMRAAAEGRLVGEYISGCPMLLKGAA